MNIVCCINGKIALTDNLMLDYCKVNDTINSILLTLKNFHKCTHLKLWFDCDGIEGIVAYSNDIDNEVVLKDLDMIYNKEQLNSALGILYNFLIEEPYNTCAISDINVTLEDTSTLEFTQELVNNLKENRGLLTDTHHSFDELYEHRTKLFAILCSINLSSWKSKNHAVGDIEMFDGMFIAGIHTKLGQYSYHCEMKYWDLFEHVEELPNAPKYDGHMPNDIDRLFSLLEK